MLTWTLKKILGTSHEREIKKLKPLVNEINKLEPKMQALEEHELKAKTAELKQKLDQGASLDDLLVEAFAVCREAGKRALRMRHYDVQLIGGMVLHKGMIAEMRTGEGKTLVATLACYLNALEGKGVHVVTVNDYLARRDAEWMGKLYGYLGLETGVVINQQGDPEKRAAYKADITYGQNNEFGFDYLRDNMKFSALEYMQRPLNYAIVDEVDSILIDEARTPLIISGQAEASSQKYKTIDECIPRLRKDEHFVVDEKAHSVSLTDEGVEAAQKLLAVSNLYDPVNLESLHILNQCLKAHTLFKRDVNYLVTDDGKVLIVDEFTGRVLPGRRWSDGLHQAVEAKEHVPIQEETRTMATITFQNLFRLYGKLAGMTGTADTEAEEFHKTYKLTVVQIPTNRDIQRTDLDDLVYKTEREKFTAVVGEILEAHEKGRPVLVGTTSVEKSAAIAKILKKQGIAHAVLNAKQHEKEAYVVAQAGRKGAITVSTNMAGRGTDIILGGNAEMLAKLEFKEQGRDSSDSETDKEDFEKLVLKYEKNCKREGDEVRDAGGLHIVGTERHESRRIDNQLRGRAGRQGDPGSSRFYVSFEDDLMRIFGGDRLKSFMGRWGMPDDEPIEHPWVSKTLQDAQRKVEARNFDIRKNLLEYDDVMNEQRKTVYKIRQQLLLGIYKPEIVDDDGKPTGTLRKIAVLPRLVEEVKPGVIELMLHFGTDTHSNGASESEAKRPTTIQGIEEIVDMEALRVAAYNTWGVRYDFKEGDGKKPEVVLDHLMEIVPLGLTEQRERLLDLVDQIISAVVEESCPLNKQPDDWDWKGIRSAFVEHFGKKPEDDYEKLHDPQDLAHTLYSQAFAIVDEKEKEMGTELWLRIFRHFYLEDIDKQWVEHLTNMEHLRDGIGLRGYGQRDPKQEYKKEGYDLFVNMMAETSSNVITKLMGVRVQKERDVERLESANAARHAAAARSMQLRHGSEPADGDEPQAPEAAASPARRALLQPARRTTPKIGRNDLCPCGSGEKFKKCHGAALEDESSSQS